MSAKIRKRKLRGAYLFTRRVLDPFCTLYLSLIQNENTFVFVFVFLFCFCFWFEKRKESIIIVIIMLLSLFCFREGKTVLWFLMKLFVF